MVVVTSVCRLSLQSSAPTQRTFHSQSEILALSPVCVTCYLSTLQVEHTLRLQGIHYYLLFVTTFFALAAI